jgi:putative FmdB family regulatory protein
MPFYEYQCGKCRHEFEARMSISDRDRAKCPKCGQGKAQRRVSMFYSSRTDAGEGHSCGGGCSNCAGGSCKSCHH